MKKAFLYLGLAVAALTLTNCNKQESDVPGLDGFKARINLVTEDTKTANDGMNTVWAEGDALSVWVADATASALDYGYNYKFTVDPETGTATGTLEDLPGTSNTWYAFYPFSSVLVNPSTWNDAQEQKGYMTVGSASNGSQTQTGNNSKAHLAGSKLPLWGIANNVAAGDPVTIAMKQVCCVVAINVTNNTNAAITVQSVEFTADTDIVGTYYIDFSAGDPVFTGSGNTYVSSTAKLAVSEAEAISAGQSAKFYIAVKPFSGNIASIKVVADQGEVVREATVAAVPITVEAGHIKTVNFTYVAPETVNYITVSEAVAADDGTSVEVGDAIVAALSTKGYIATDGQSNVYVYANGNPGVAVGDKVKISATKTTYYGLPELTGPTSVIVSSGNDIPRTELIDLTSGIDNYSSSAADYITVTGTLEKSGNYYNVRVAGAERYASPDYMISSIDPSALVNQEVKMTGYFNTIHSSKNYVKVIVTEIVGTGSQPAVTLSSIEVSNAKTSYNVGDQFVKPTVTAYYSDQSSKDVSASATFSGYDLTKAGSYTVEVSYTEGGVTKTTSYGITVSAGDDPNVNTVSMTMAKYVDDNKCTVSTGNDVVLYPVLDLSTAVRMSTTGAANCGAFYANGDDMQWRLYQNKGGDVTVQVADGCNLVSVSFTYAATNGGQLEDAEGSAIGSGSVCSCDGTSFSLVVGNSGDATNGQVRITAVEVKYTGSGTLPPVDQSGPTETTTSISMPNNATVYVGETFSLNATANVQATITYESEDPNIASVDANGVVTGVAEGTVKVYARIAAVTGSYTAAERYCNVTVSEKPQDVGGTWEATALSNIADGTQFVLVGTNANGSYAMSNDNGTSAAPKAVSVTISNGKISNPASNLVFTMKVMETGYIFTTDNGEKWVYTTATNNGIRIGTNENNLFNLGESDYLTVSDGEKTRYLGIYSSQDWRGYTSINSNIKDQTFTFYVKK